MVVLHRTVEFPAFTVVRDGKVFHNYKDCFPSSARGCRVLVEVKIIRSRKSYGRRDSRLGCTTFTLDGNKYQVDYLAAQDL